MRIFEYPNVDYDLINSVLKKTNKKLRIDVGTSINAPVTKYWLKNLSDIISIGIEPNPDCVYKDNLWDGKIVSIPKVFENEPQKEFYFHIIGACDNIDSLSTSKFHVMTVNSGCSSLLEPILPFKNGIILDRMIEVKTFPMQELLDKIDIDFIELIKIDTQGKDLDIVKSMKNHIHKVCYLDLEDDCTKDYKGASSRNSIVSYMNNVGFHLYENYDGNLRFKNVSIKIPEHFNNITGDM